MCLYTSTYCTACPSPRAYSFSVYQFCTALLHELQRINEDPAVAAASQAELQFCPPLCVPDLCRNVVGGVVLVRGCERCVWQGVSLVGGSGSGVLVVLVVRGVVVRGWWWWWVWRSGGSWDWDWGWGWKRKKTREGERERKTSAMRIVTSRGMRSPVR
ncbi:hypothetical protein P170DRAFT_478594 [Aspergillus steynii IBT 23096]|uniref:Uncharacterized protein n=1 Tax=Aspergillus steynii IBT 23096 TaxID=1392250 RepID=A0A2I2FYD5_9EURO|nr:uncharacterized protein P170DRAFT_478594 [Aspergillus steynii IBT 23096]PLB45642.1 hypothetical protein P170DRAFT_478594 [Aspergillus steynii IBT 23096]